MLIIGRAEPRKLICIQCWDFCYTNTVTQQFEGEDADRLPLKEGVRTLRVALSAGM